MGNQSVLVTGGAGFLGSFVVEKLKQAGFSQIFVPRSAEYDLREQAVVRALYQKVRPQIVIHLAARVGGIGANRLYPAEFFYDNAAMGLNLIEEGRRHGIEKFVNVGSICSYPKFATVPFQEDAIWDGYPEETNAPYGLAKKLIMVQAMSYAQQYGLEAINLLPVNIYGPREHFDLENSHVIPALIRKCVEAKEQGKPELVLWGDGSPTREFLYVEDAAAGIVLATEQYHKPEPVNLGTGGEVTIRELSEKVVRLTGYQGKVTWDTTRPNGQPRRCVSTERAKAAFGFQAKVSLEEGLKQTIQWFLKERPDLKESAVLPAHKNNAGPRLNS